VHEFAAEVKPLRLMGIHMKFLHARCLTRCQNTGGRGPLVQPEERSVAGLRARAGGLFAGQH